MFSDKENNHNRAVTEQQFKHNRDLEWRVIYSLYAQVNLKKTTLEVIRFCNINAKQIFLE